MKGKGFFWLWYKSSEPVRPCKGQTADRCPSCWGVWVETRSPWQLRCFQKAALSVDLYQGWREGRGRKGGTKLDGCMDSKTLWGEGESRGRIWNATNAKEESEKKSRSVFPAAVPLGLQGGKARACSDIPVPSPESCSLWTASELQGTQWEPRLARQSIPPAHTRAGLQRFCFKINLALISVGFRGIRGRSTCSCLVFWQV